MLPMLSFARGLVIIVIVMTAMFSVASVIIIVIVVTTIMITPVRVIPVITSVPVAMHVVHTFVVYSDRTDTCSGPFSSRETLHLFSIQSISSFSEKVL
ncbi:hypothetical protein Krac_4479 [Ktedonobacter racemifer DSM 44963]|uniref:Uncharacterized protein n=1 Tax=Ktedonobacter racemifer DSM 44963 TaxID=485913 RepID=D6TSV7_KTERA|nr:hypothetical protein Krac_4479 [Ktedonobacter racemifer DSM 44963]